jgi:hypothetical protein
VYDLQPLVSVTCKCGRDARVSHCAVHDSSWVWPFWQAVRSGTAALALKAEAGAPAELLARSTAIALPSPCHRAPVQENDGFSFPPLLRPAHRESEASVK